MYTAECAWNIIINKMLPHIRLWFNLCCYTENMFYIKKKKNEIGGIFCKLNIIQYLIIF